MDSKYLKSIMEQQSATAYGIAKQTGMSESLIRRIITGKTENPSIDTLIKIADVLNITLDELTGRSRTEANGKK